MRKKTTPIDVTQPETWPATLETAHIMRALNIGKNKALELLADGTIPGRKIGSTWKINRDVFIEWMRG